MDAVAEEAADLSDVVVASAALCAHFHDGACSNACACADDAVVVVAADGVVVTKLGQPAVLHWLPCQSKSLKQLQPQ
jgi:hypothetical protein